MLNSEKMELFQAYVIDLLEIHYSTLGFAPQDANEEHLKILGRISANKWMCKLHYKDCVENAQNYFLAWMVVNEKIPADIKDVVLNTAISSGNSTHWEFLLEKFKTSTVDSDKKQYLIALSRTEDIDTIKR